MNSYHYHICLYGKRSFTREILIENVTYTNIQETRLMKTKNTLQKEVAIFDLH